MEIPVIIVPFGDPKMGNFFRGDGGESSPER
ncbi:hypothetical protein A2U01_0054740, partial [Trifolium medium]|nr:hypothetical protein [Trifolium medium]